MRFVLASLLFWMVSCSNQKDTNSDTSVAIKTDTPLTSRPPLENGDSLRAPEVFSNARFRNVIVKEVGLDSFRITGEGQIFEASFNWVVEDGHNELKSGYTTTDAGAPAWGKFDFTVGVSKMRVNSVLHIILYEASAEDGRRTHELPIVLK